MASPTRRAASRYECSSRTAEIAPRMVSAERSVPSMAIPGARERHFLAQSGSIPEGPNIGWPRKPLSLGREGFNSY